MDATDRWLDTMQIAAPCPERWESMQGDDRTRHCERCALSVYNVAGLTRAEAEALIHAAEGRRVCLRLARRADGTVLTADCPVGLAARARRRVVATVAAAIGMFAAAVAWAADTVQPGPPGSGGSPAWARRLPAPLRWIFGPAPEPEILMGAVACPDPFPVPTPPTAPDSPVGDVDG